MFYHFSEKIRHGILCEVYGMSSLISLKKKKKTFAANVINALMVNAMYKSRRFYDKY